MNVLSLFSGIGGLDLGLERAGMTVVGQVEIDPWCRTILAKHWPEVPRHDDVRTAVEWWLGPVADAEGSGRGTGWPRGSAEHGEARLRIAQAGPAAGSAGRPAVDVVAGGFPCQPVSLAGKGLAQADSRWLWPAFAGVIRELRPRYAVMENVPGLLGRGLGDVLADLAGIGYDAEWDCVPAAFVGAPHIRNRVFIVAYPDGQQHQIGAPEVSRTATAIVPMADAEGSRRGTQWAHNAAEAGTNAVPGYAGQQPASLADTASQRRTRSVFPQPHLVNDGPQPAHRHEGTRRNQQWWAAEPNVGRVAHGIPRRVDRLRGLGNAVVPQVAEHIGRLIMEASAA